MRFFFALFISSFILAPLSTEALDALEISRVLFDKVNETRKSENMVTLKINQVLSRAAQAKAEDMMDKGYFDHSSPEGRIFSEWIDEAGYKYVIAGENLASNIYTLDLEKIMDYWLASPTHRANIVSEKFTETGLGVVEGTIDGKPAVLVSQIFAAPVEESASPATITSGKAVLQDAPPPSPQKKIIAAPEHTEKPLLNGATLVAGYQATQERPEKVEDPVPQPRYTILEKARDFFFFYLGRIFSAFQK